MFQGLVKDRFDDQYYVTDKIELRWIALGTAMDRTRYCDGSQFELRSIAVAISEIPIKGMHWRKGHEHP